MVVAVATVLILVHASTPAGAAQHADDRAFVVTLHADGSATVAVTMAFDLDSDSEQAAFKQVKDNKTVREAGGANALP